MTEHTTTTSAETMYWMERAAAAEAELESALAVVDLYQRRAFDAEAVADALRAQLDAAIVHAIVAFDDFRLAPSNAGEQLEDKS